MCDMQGDQLCGISTQFIKLAKEDSVHLLCPVNEYGAHQLFLFRFQNTVSVLLITNSRGSINIMSSKYEGKVKSSSLAYNRRETRDKRPLIRDPDRTWCHLHTNVKLSWSQPMNP